MRACNTKLIYMLTLSMNKTELGSSLNRNPFRHNSYELHFKRSIDRDPTWVLEVAEGHTEFPQ